MRSDPGSDYITALSDITSSRSLVEGDVDALAREITQRVSEVCGVERVNVWLFNDDETQLSCIDLYCASTGSHSSGLVLHQEQFANEFHALKTNPYVASEHPLTDPRTSGYAEGYLEPNRITSMLDVVVAYSDRHFGLLCLEHVDRPHVWQRSEIEFAGQVAEKIAIAVANRRARHAEQALRASELRFRTIFDRAPVGLAEVSPSGRYLRVNQRLCEITGYGAQQMRDLHFRDITHSDDLGKDEAGLEALVSGHATSYATEKRYLRKDGSPAWVALFVTSVRTAEGDVDFLLTVVQEITERVAAEQKLRESAENLSRSNRALQTRSAGNEALVRAHNEADLLRQMMSVLGGIGGYPLAFVGYATDEAGSQVEPRACVGVAAEALARSPLCWTDREHGQCIVGRAILRGEMQLIRDFAARADSLALPASFTQVASFSAMLILPLRPGRGERPFAAMCIATAAAGAFDSGEMKLLAELAGDLGYGIANLRTALASRAASERLRRSLEATIEAIAATMDERHPYTAGHQRRVAQLATAIARELRLPAHTVEGIHFGALIHDIGCVQIPAELLAKPRRLTAVEFELIKTHPQAACDIIGGIEFDWPIAQMVLQHHERLDGSGYPQGLRGDQIIQQARILAVADVVEAMTSHRPYRSGLGIDVALQEIVDKRGRCFDPQVVDACVSLFREQGFQFTRPAAK